jgi:hypothetical protein
MSWDFAGLADLFAEPQRPIDETAYYRANAPRPLNLRRATPALAMLAIVVCLAIGGFAH